MIASLRNVVKRFGYVQALDHLGFDVRDGGGFGAARTKRGRQDDRDSHLGGAHRRRLDFVGLADHANKAPKTFSGGMQRRLNIACALVHEPRFLIMDEPTVGIDPQSRNYILQSVKRLAQNGATVLYTSHYVEEVQALASCIVVMVTPSSSRPTNFSYLRMMPIDSHRRCGNCARRLC